MKYVCVALLLAVVICGYLIGRLYYSRGRADCESRHQAAVSAIVSEGEKTRADVARRALITPSSDIRDWLRANYTIAD